MRDSGLSLSQVRKAVKEQWGPEVPSEGATTVSTRFTHCLRRYTNPETALNIVKKLASEPEETVEDYEKRHEKWSSTVAYWKPGDNDHYVIVAECGHTLGSCRCGSCDKSKYKAPIPCPECWAKQTGNPRPFKR